MPGDVLHRTACPQKGTGMDGRIEGGCALKIPAAFRAAATSPCEAAYHSGPNQWSPSIIRERARGVADTHIRIYIHHKADCHNYVYHT
jgi:hypothetical protein